jgi:hypothetical protein
MLLTVVHSLDAGRQARTTEDIAGALSRAAHVPFETAAAAAGDVMGRAQHYLPVGRAHTDAQPQRPLVHEDSTQMRAADHREQPGALHLGALQDDSASAADSEAQAEPVEATAVSSSAAELPPHQHARLQRGAAEDGMASDAAAAAEDHVQPEAEPASPGFEPWPAPSPSMASSADVRMHCMLQCCSPAFHACRLQIG